MSEDGVPDKSESAKSLKSVERRLTGGRRKNSSFLEVRASSLAATGDEEFSPVEQRVLKMQTIEQHIIDINAGKQLS